MKTNTNLFGYSDKQINVWLNTSVSVYNSEGYLVGTRKVTKDFLVTLFCDPAVRVLSEKNGSVTVSSHNWGEESEVEIHSTSLSKAVKNK